MNGFRQVQMAYLALVSLLDKLVQPSYTLAAQIRPLPTPKVVLKLDPRKIEKEGLVNWLGWKSQFRSWNSITPLTTQVH